MTTTIQVAQSTVMHLRSIRDRLKMASYNDAVTYLLHQETSRQSFWAAGKRKMNMKHILEDLRDKSDRP